MYTLKKYYNKNNHKVPLTTIFIHVESLDILEGQFPSLVELDQLLVSS